MLIQPQLKLPEWLVEENKREIFIVSMEEKVRYVHEVVRKNLENTTGGPFAAAVFDIKTNQLIATGVNLVTYTNLSIAHAEVVTFSIAQTKLNCFSLADERYELVSSCEPCAMCYGAIVWSGIKKVIYSATKEDAQAIGFDEGDKPLNWKESYRKRGIEVVGPILQNPGKDLLESYKYGSGIIYNG